MPYDNPNERQNIINRVIHIVIERLNHALDTDTLEDFLKLFGIELEEKNPAYALYNKRTKILVFGSLKGSKKDYIKCAKKLGIEEYNLEFVEYLSTKNYNVEKLRNSEKFSDIICGPMPHKIEGIGDYSSFIALIENNKDEYPKMFNAVNNLSINVFKQALMQTRFIDKFGSKN